MTLGKLHLPWLAIGFLLAHLQLLAKLPFLSCMAPTVGLAPRIYDKGECSSLQSAPTMSIWDPFGLCWAWEKIQLSLEYSLCLFIVMKKINDHRKSIHLSGRSVPQEQNSWESHAMSGKLQTKRQKSLLVIKHPVNLCFALPLGKQNSPNAKNFT